ncbi:protein SAWADEE HOMEODOMAIN HOMOLOG 1-like isoform X2 [Actinidia eriantha]|uniref:protein SAWADEE HOMEODOMAIN HOMOLOG 1-like isoform X2 n=1 Tax=Actinidia eriantha TaxID=165200 RepID=UPI00258FE008|nr:protein SAWADEE HOMEODOMAIN HOMOLOG 1-like isoform X2 [Actinidia eriantha]
MDRFESTEMKDDLPEFTLAEIMVLENLYKAVGEKSLSQEFCEEVVNSFSCSKYRTGKPAIEWEQVQSWFLDKQKELAAKVPTSTIAHEEFIPRSNLALTVSAPEILLKSKGERIAGLTELAFEAKSFKDSAWYDVAAFLNYRVLCTGELVDHMLEIGLMAVVPFRPPWMEKGTHHPPGYMSSALSHIMSALCWHNPICPTSSPPCNV